MKLKTLLLGTAAAFAVAGSAQAADLAVAESVEYVKVCDAYGAGYFYIPGSDVCLKIGGYVQFRTTFGDGDVGDVGLNYGDDATDSISDYSAGWKFYTETSLNATAKWMTDWGAATVFVDYRSVVDESTANGANHTVFLDSAYFKLGGFLVGHKGSTFDYGTNGMIGYNTFDHDKNQNQLQWSTTLGGMGLFLAAEDPRDNVGSSEYYTGDMPDLVAAITGSTGGFDWKLSAAATDTIYGTGWAGQIGAAYTWSGSFIKLQAAVSDDAGAAYSVHLGPQNSGDTYYHVLAQGGIAWTSAFSTILTGSYASGLGVGSVFGSSSAADRALELSAEADWTIAKGVQVGLAVDWIDPNVGPSLTEAQLRFQAGF